MAERSGSGRVEMTFRVVLNRTQAGGRARVRSVDNDTAFYVLGLLKAQLAENFGSGNWLVELADATGQRPEFLRTMNAFARAHQAACDELERSGQVVVEDADLADVFRTVHQLQVVDLGGRWRVERPAPPPRRGPAAPLTVH